MRYNEKLIEKSPLLKIIIEKIERDYSNDIATFTCYGSFVTGGYSPLSDIDFFFIPKSERGFGLSKQFIINSIGYDLWPITWSRAKKIANLEDPLQSLFTDGKVLYYSSNKDLADYNEIINSIRVNLIDDTIVTRQINTLLRDIQSKYQIMLGNTNHTMGVAYEIVEKLLRVIALRNNTYLSKGIKHIETEFAGMQSVPSNFLSTFYQLIEFKSKSETDRLLGLLIKSVADISKIPFKKVTQTQANAPIASDLIGFYEEFKSMYNKIVTSCQAKNYPQTVYAAVMIDKTTDEILSPFVTDKGLPRLAEYLHNKDFVQIQKRAAKHEAFVLELLRKNNIVVNEYITVEEFRKSFLG